MNTKLVETLTAKYKKTKHPELNVGDVVEIHTKIKEGDKERIQVFKGTIIAQKGKEINKTFTVRKISYGVGVEKIFPFYSSNVQKIKIVKQGKVKRSKLYYLRQRVGKAALKAGVQIPAEGKSFETELEEEKVEEKKSEKAEDKKEEKAVEPETGEAEQTKAKKVEPEKEDKSEDEEKKPEFSHNKKESEPKEPKKEKAPEEEKPGK